METTKHTVEELIENYHNLEFDKKTKKYKYFSQKNNLSLIEIKKKDALKIIETLNLNAINDKDSIWFCSDQYIKSLIFNANRRIKSLKYELIEEQKELSKLKRAIKSKKVK